MYCLIAKVAVSVRFSLALNVLLAVVTLSLHFTKLYPVLGVAVMVTDTRIHGIWCDMRSRCNLKTNHNYHGYGGRGIKVCDSWEGENGFKCFYEWSMRNGYTDKLTIDRIDNNGMYSPDNCRWTDMKTQCNNTRRNVFVEYKGKTKTIGQWAVELNLKYSRIYNRIAKLGWSAVDAFEKP